MASSGKVEYPPLLSVGFHEMTVKEVRTLCVDRFPLSKKRDDIMTKLESVIDTLRKEKVEADVWVDGSFLTEKIDPEDSDILLHVQGDFYDNAAPEQRKAIDWVNSNLKATHLCDSYVHFEYPKGHVWHATGEWMKAYWIKQFGFSRPPDEEFKGMALIRLS
jgi:hypothetical protein